MSHSSVLIVSDDPEFARTLAGRWQAERQVPEITLATSDIWRPDGGPDCDLVIVGALRSEVRSSILRDAGVMPGTAVIYVADDDKDLPSLRAELPGLIVVPRHDDWATAVFLVATEVLRRVDAARRAQRAERMVLISERYATLGRYMLEMRPGVNNALTSVLGNADLLLIDSERISSERREQIRAIHTMALRLNEVFQRFSSLATELWAGENESQSEMATESRGLVNRR